MGLLIMMGLPNAMSVHQEMDALFGAFKAATYARGEMILIERMRIRGLANTALRDARRREEAPAVVVGVGDDGGDLPQQQPRCGRNGLTQLPPVTMGFNDLPEVVNGLVGDHADLKPFAKHFTKQKIVRSWEKIGFVPFTRACLKHKNVRHELGQEDRDNRLEVLQESYEELIEQVEVSGSNAGVFDAVIPTAVQVTREVEEDDQVRQLVATKGAFQAGGLWNVCTSRIGNCSVMLRAQQEQLNADAEKVARQCQTKPDRVTKLLVSAQHALAKYQQTPVLMTDGDWRNIIQWVLQESKCGGLMKDLQKKDAIVAKLSSLDQAWESFIPHPTKL